MEDNRLIPDIRPEKLEEVTETYTPEGGAEQTATYKIFNAWPIVGKILGKLHFMQTHTAAVWWNALAGITLRTKIEQMDGDIAQLDGNTIKTINLGTYDHNIYTADDVIKEIFDSVPVGTKETYIYSFTAVYSYRAIVQTYSNHDYASAIVFSYGKAGILLYRRFDGFDYKYTTQWTGEEI